MSPNFTTSEATARQGAPHSDEYPFVAARPRSVRRMLNHLKLKLLWLPFAALLAGGVACLGAAKLPDGRALYRKECASCHGKSGEGVKDKYADGLHGDWSLEKLTRYIERNMPEDDPDKINGPEVEAVSRYINDNFYSREARAKKNPARIELVHLTNLQYANAVADLLRSFTGGESTFGSERGLRASYQPRGPLGNSRKNIDRVDREVNFSPIILTPCHLISPSARPSRTRAPTRRRRPTSSPCPGAARSSPTRRANTSSSSRRRTACVSGSTTRTSR